MKKQLFYLTAIILIAGACNKVKRSTHKLEGTWKAEVFTINGAAETELPSFSFDDCDAYDEVCEGELFNDEDGHADFAWQFREKGKVFEYSNQASMDGHSHAAGTAHAEEEAVMLSQELSGIYEVIEQDKKHFKIKSSSTLGYNGQEVVIELHKTGDSHSH